MKIKIIILGLFLNFATLYSQVEPPYINDNYEISTLEHLRWVSESPVSWDKNILLMNDIDATDTKNWNEGKGWKAIGRLLSDTAINFTGSFNGNGFKISKLLINNIDSLSLNSQYNGFFGIIQGKESKLIKIANLGLENIDIKGRRYTGGLAAYSYLVEFTDCFVTGKLTGMGYSALLVGFNENSNVSRCYALGSLNVGKSSGGLIGNNWGGDKNYIDECFVIADIKGTLSVGGFSYLLTGQVTNCFAICNLDIDSVSSGFTWGGPGNTNIINSYSASKVKFKKNNEIYSFSYAPKSKLYKNINCFCDSEIDTNNPGRQVIPKSTAEMKTKETFTSATWDFDSVWAISPNLNNGYPYLQFAEKFFSPVKDELIANFEITISPNPAGDFITIKLGAINPTLKRGVDETSEILIYNTLGEKVMAESIHPMTASHRMNIEALPRGIYFVKIGGETAKFVKM